MLSNGQVSSRLRFRQVSSYMMFAASLYAWFCDWFWVWVYAWLLLIRIIRILFWPWFRNFSNNVKIWAKTSLFQGKNNSKFVLFVGALDPSVALCLCRNSHRGPLEAPQGSGSCIIFKSKFHFFAYVVRTSWQDKENRPYILTSKEKIILKLYFLWGVSPHQWHYTCAEIHIEVLWRLPKGREVAKFSRVNFTFLLMLSGRPDRITKIVHTLLTFWSDHRSS